MKIYEIHENLLKFIENQLKFNHFSARALRIQLARCFQLHLTHLSIYRSKNKRFVEARSNVLCRRWAIDMFIIQPLIPQGGGGAYTLHNVSHQPPIPQGAAGGTYPLPGGGTHYDWGEGAPNPESYI